MKLNHNRWKSYTKKERCAIHSAQATGVRGRGDEPQPCGKIGRYVNVGRRTGETGDTFGWGLSFI